MLLERDASGGAAAVTVATEKVGMPAIGAASIAAAFCYWCLMSCRGVGSNRSGGAEEDDAQRKMMTMAVRSDDLLVAVVAK